MKTECTGCGLPTEVDDYGFCNRCHDERDGMIEPYYSVAAGIWIDLQESICPTDRPQFYACGICEHNHPIDWNGDCRDDANRFTNAELDETYGPYGWEEMEMPT